MTKTLPQEETADRAAAAARQAVDEAERAITGGRRISLDKLTALVTRARHADLTATSIRLFEVSRDAVTARLRQVTAASVLSVTDRSSCRFA